MSSVMVRWTPGGRFVGSKMGVRVIPHGSAVERRERRMDRVCGR
jgi:hypothetical protein